MAVQGAELGVPKSDSDASAAQGTQDASVFSAAVTKEQAAAIRAGVTLDDILKVFEQGDERMIRTISILLNALGDSAAKAKAENRELKKLKESVQKQESQIEEFKSMLVDTGQDLKDIIAALNQISKEDTPPEPDNERRTSMITLAHLLKQAQERINHRGRPETSLEDENHNFTKA